MLRLGRSTILATMLIYNPTRNGQNMKITEYYKSTKLKIRYGNLKDKIEELRDDVDDDKNTLDELDVLIEDFYEYARKQSLSTETVSQKNQ